MHGIGEPTLCATEEEVLAKMGSLMAKLEAKGYTRKKHATETDGYLLTTPRKGSSMCM